MFTALWLEALAGYLLRSGWFYACAFTDGSTFSCLIFLSVEKPSRACGIKKYGGWSPEGHGPAPSHLCKCPQAYSPAIGARVQAGRALLNRAHRSTSLQSRGEGSLQGAPAHLAHSRPWSAFPPPPCPLLPSPRDQEPA